jgi:hypothetical protein
MYLHPTLSHFFSEKAITLPTNKAQAEAKD